MNLTISPISTQTTSSQNISSRGLFRKLFGTNKKLVKDVFVASTVTTVGMTGIVASNQTQNSENLIRMR